MTKLLLAELAEFKELVKLQKESPLDYYRLIKLMYYYRQVSLYGKFDFNNRLYDFFHIFKLNYNINNIKKITQELIDHYIVCDDCWICSGNILPRPKDCYETDICQMKLRFSDKEKKSPFMELASKNNYPLNIGLARHNFSFIVYYGFDFIFRTTQSNWWDLHHTVDKFWDKPGSIKVNQKNNHLRLHAEIDIQEKRVYELEEIIRYPIESCRDKDRLKQLREERRILIIRWNYEKKLLSDLRSRVDDDPRIMRIIWEINDRIKRGCL